MDLGLKITNGKITKYEKSEIMAHRKLQLLNGGVPLIKSSSKDINHILNEEYKQKLIPYYIKRTIGSHTEIWAFQDMIL